MGIVSTRSWGYGNQPEVMTALDKGQLALGARMLHRNVARLSQECKCKELGVLARWVNCGRAVLLTIVIVQGIVWLLSRLSLMGFMMQV